MLCLFKTLMILLGFVQICTVMLWWIYAGINRYQIFFFIVQSYPRDSWSQSHNKEQKTVISATLTLIIFPNRSIKKAILIDRMAMYNK